MEQNKTKTQATANIILEDKELSKLIQQLVEKCGKEGFCKSHLLIAVNTVWKDKFFEEEKKELLTSEEEAILQKVERFIKHYEKDLINFYDESLRDKKRVIGNNAQAKERFLKKYYTILCSMCIVFGRENSSVTQQKIVDFAKRNFNSRLSGISSDIKLLRYFMYSHLYFDADTHKPTYSKSSLSPSANALYSVNDFSNFRSKYSFANTDINITSVATFWVIKHFF